MQPNNTDTLKKREDFAVTLRKKKRQEKVAEKRRKLTEKRNENTIPENNVIMSQADQNLQVSEYERR